jgi:hypothetical protein
MQTLPTLSHGSTFGPFSRYQLHRHDSSRGPEFSCWMVLDAERPDEITGTPGVIRQEATIEAAVAGLLAESDPGFYDQAAEGEVEAADLALELDDELDPIAIHYDRMGDFELELEGR